MADFDVIIRPIQFLDHEVVRDVGYVLDVSQEDVFLYWQTLDGTG
ncbi:MAG: hypothetical protein R3C05_25935 [Pirellulaceae bacterium]